MTEQIRNRKRKRARRRRNLTSSTLKKRLHHFLSNQQLLQTENFRSRTWEGLFANVCGCVCVCVCWKLRWWEDLTSIFIIV